VRLEQLQLILTLLTTGSLRGAAEKMHVTAPALTKALQQLEDELGTALVNRSAKGVRLTPAGELLAARASSALREIDRAREEVNWFVQHRNATLTIACSPAAAFHILPGALFRLRTRWPQVQIRVLEVVYPRGLTMLRAGEVDLYVGPLPPDGIGRDLSRQSLFDVQLVLIGRSGHPLAGAQTLREIQGAEWINTGSPGGPGDPMHLNFEALHLSPPTLTLSCESFTTLLAMLTNMDALALVPQSFFDMYGQRPGLVRLPIADPLPYIKVCAAWRADAPLTTPASFLLDSLELEASVLN
jgi:DNA-binding transcriptional LysR family regulator